MNDESYAQAFRDGAQSIQDRDKYCPACLVRWNDPQSVGCQCSTVSGPGTIRYDPETAAEIMYTLHDKLVAEIKQRKATELELASYQEPEPT